MANISNFAKEQLLKYGWTEGKGLGKKEDGISQAIKPTLKFDNAGIGYKETPTEHWWQAHFDNAAKNIKVESHNDQVSLSVLVDNNKTTTVEKNERNEPYQKFFLKTGVLKETCNGLSQSLCATSVKSKKKEASTNLVNNQLTDEQLYAACGGRTAHKTARHALTLSGKLERIAQQDSILLGASICTSSTSSINGTSQYNTDKINYNKGIIDLNYGWHKYKSTDFSKKPIDPLSNDKKEYINKQINKLPQELYCQSTLLRDLKEDDAKSEHKSLKKKRKRDQDYVMRIDPHETEDIFFFRKKQRTSLDLSSKKVISKRVGGNIKQKSSNEQISQIARGFVKMNIKQESDNVYYETKKLNSNCMEQLEEQNRPRDASRKKYLKLADAWKKICKTGIKKPIEYLLIKRLLEVNKHMDLPSNIEKCIIEHPYLKNLFHDFYFMVTRKQLDGVTKQKHIMRYKKIHQTNTQSYLTSDSKKNREK